MSISLTSKGQIILCKPKIMKLLSYLVLATVAFSMGIAPVFAQTTQQFAVKDPTSGQSFQVNYSMAGGTVSDVIISQNDTSLIVSVNAASDGNLTMALPRALIDAKAGTNDDQFIVLVDGADTDFTENKTSTDRTITVAVPQSTTQIEVIGTQVVPEFGSLSAIVLVIAVLSIVAISAKTRLKFA